MRENQGIGCAMGDMPAGSKRIGKRMPAGSVDRTETEAAIERGEREPCPRLRIRPVGNGASEITSNQTTPSIA